MDGGATADRARWTDGRLEVSAGGRGASPVGSRRPGRGGGLSDVAAAPGGGGGVAVTRTGVLGTTNNRRSDADGDLVDCSGSCADPSEYAAPRAHVAPAAAPAASGKQDRQAIRALVGQRGRTPIGTRPSSPAARRPTMGRGARPRNDAEPPCHRWSPAGTRLLAEPSVRFGAARLVVAWSCRLGLTNANDYSDGIPAPTPTGSALSPVGARIAKNGRGQAGGAGQLRRRRDGGSGWWYDRAGW